MAPSLTRSTRRPKTFSSSSLRPKYCSKAFRPSTSWKSTRKSKSLRPGSNFSPAAEPKSSSRRTPKRAQRVLISSRRDSISLFSTAAIAAILAPRQIAPQLRKTGTAPVSVWYDQPPDSLRRGNGESRGARAPHHPGDLRYAAARRGGELRHAARVGRDPHAEPRQVRRRIGHLHARLPGGAADAVRAALDLHGASHLPVSQRRFSPYQGRL